MPRLEDGRKFSVDFERAAEVAPLLKKDLAALEKARDSYANNFLRFKVKFLSLFYNEDEERPRPGHPLNKASDNLELSQLMELRNLIADEDSMEKISRLMGQNSERLSIACALLASYMKYLNSL